MTNEEFGGYLPRYETVIRAIARKLAQRNDALVEELIQEGYIALWRCNPRLARDNEDAYIRQAIKFRMIDFVRKERLEDTESLTPHLEAGRQVIKDEDTGDLRLVEARPGWTGQRNPHREEDNSGATRLIEEQREDGDGDES